MRFAVAAAMVAGTMGLSGLAMAQQTPAPAPQEEVMGAPAQAEAPAAPAGPQWSAFSRSDDRSYLIDMSSVVKDGDEATVWIARVSKSSPDGDFSHTQDHFGVRCEADQSHVVESADIAEDGEARDAYETDEPWEPIAAGSFDEAIKSMACGEMVPTGTAYDSVKAYIVAGRP